MTTDSAGTPLQVGYRVAYNLSGNVVPGRVVEIKPQVRVSQWHTKDDIRIMADDGHISRVRNGNSVLVIG